jgi:hypothetical protein
LARLASGAALLWAASEEARRVMAAVAKKLRIVLNIALGAVR